VFSYVDTEWGRSRRSIYLPSRLLRSTRVIYPFLIQRGKNKRVDMTFSTMRMAWLVGGAMHSNARAGRVFLPSCVTIDPGGSRLAVLVLTSGRPEGLTRSGHWQT
jgi:hypothetical protein